MKRMIIAIAILLVAVGGLLLSLSPDSFSLVILIVMCVVIGIGFLMGLMPSIAFASGFKMGRQGIEQVKEVQVEEAWIAVFKMDALFHNNEMDRIFKEYRNKVEEQKEYEEIESDIEDYLSENYLSLCTWQGLILQIPGILTGLGILGTFVGLITGISSIGFSSVDAALESISVLLSGIETAFYTSIAGVVLSILFNILNRLTWNTLLREQGLFLESFHKTVIPSTEEAMRIRQDKQLKAIINRMDRNLRSGGYGMVNSGGEAGLQMSERNLMPQVIEGLKNGEFTFFLQPRVYLSNKKIVAAMARVRWNHEGLGELSPVSFIPMLERNGFITRLDSYLWEQVFITLRKWIDSGIRPVPIAVCVSKTDLLAMDVEAFFAKMLEKYRIPPRNMEIEISKACFIQSPDTAMEVSSGLRRLGFKVILNGFDGDYISVNMLENFEVDALKLDLTKLEEREIEQIESFFEKARKLGIEMLAEGIENTEQITYLKRAGCLEGQGYYFYKPMSIEDFEAKME